MNVLFLAHPGTNARSVFLDCARGFERAGCRVFHWELAPMWQATERDKALAPRLVSEFTALFAAFVKANRIDASVAMWANGLLSLMNAAKDGRIVSAFDAIGLPHLLFWLDAPHWAHSGNFRAHFRSPLLAGAKLLHVINNPATAREMETVLGFANVVSRPYGVDEEVFRPYPEERKELDVVFSSGPGDPPPTELALKELESDEPDWRAIRAEAARAALADLEPLAHRSPQPASMAALFRSLVGAQIENRDEPMLDRLDRLRTDPGLSAAAELLLANPALYVDATMKVRGVERFERAFTVAYLARRFRVGVFGGGDYSAWGAPVQTLGMVPWESQARMYARGRVGLNVMRWQDDVGLILKCFEITASGVPCLVAQRRGLEELFGPDEVAAFTGPADAARRIRELLDSPGRLAELSERGRARTLRDHTWTRWARDLMPRLAALK